MGRRATSTDAQWAIAGVGLTAAAIIGYVAWKGSKSSATSSTSSTTPSNSAWLPVTSVPAGADFAIMIPSPTTAMMDQVVNVLSHLPGGHTISLPGQMAPPGWPVGDDPNAFRAMGNNGIGQAIPTSAPLLAWIKV
jgi:hypothetical protein